jgi:hypothetical protein
MSYPTWRTVSPSLVVSEEAVDGEPDFRLVRDPTDKRWYVGWRTSAHWSGNFATLAEAKANVQDQVAR